MLVVLVFIVEVKANPDRDSTDRARSFSPPGVLEAPLSGTDASSGPVIVMQHEDIERLLETQI